MKKRGRKTKVNVEGAEIIVVASKEVVWDGKKWRNHSAISFWEVGKGIWMSQRHNARETIKAVWKAALSLPTFGRPIYIEGTTEKRHRVYCALLKRAGIPFKEVKEHKEFPEFDYIRIEAKDWPGN